MGKVDKDDSSKRASVPLKAFVDKALRRINEWDADLYEELNAKNQTRPLAGQELADFNRVKDFRPKKYKGRSCCDPALFWFDNALITSTIK